MVASGLLVLVLSLAAAATPAIRELRRRTTPRAEGGGSAAQESIAS
jgi:hypothetical protein